MSAPGEASTMGRSDPSDHQVSKSGAQSTRLCRLPPPPCSTDAQRERAPIVIIASWNKHGIRDRLRKEVRPQFTKLDLCRVIHYDCPRCGELWLRLAERNNLGTASDKM